MKAACMFSHAECPGYHVKLNWFQTPDLLTASKVGLTSKTRIRKTETEMLMLTW